MLLQKNILYTYVIHRKYIQFVGERKIVKDTGHYESAYKNESLKEKKWGLGAYWEFCK